LSQTSHTPKIKGEFMSVPSVISPEAFDIANAFLTYGSIENTAEQLMLSKEEVARVLETPEVTRYIDSIYLDRGYRNREKLGSVLDKIIDAKLEEALETGIYTSKDLLEVLQLAHKMRMDELKMTKDITVPGVAVQVNNQFGGDTNYGRLMEKLIG
jgi:hypothetical protein